MFATATQGGKFVLFTIFLIQIDLQDVNFD